MIELIKAPWPWYVSGPLIGLMVPLLLLIGNKPFGLSSTLKHMCAMCAPYKPDYFRYDWKKDIWNLSIILGIIAGGWVASTFLVAESAPEISPATIAALQKLGVKDFNAILPRDIFNYENIFSQQVIIMLGLGGFLVGFGSRYAEGCTSGHAIMRLSVMDWKSLIAVIGFFIGGLISTHILLPLILN
ncbi:MAG: YeeE/YedE family protein [Cytophagaceae bacterium]